MNVALAKMALKEDWYVEPVTNHPTLNFPESWYCVTSPDNGVIAAFPTHEAAFGYYLIAARHDL